MEMLPKDPVILLSVVNTKLRDFYSDLDQLCEDLGVDREELCGKLAGIGYEYSPESNQFK